MIDILRDFYDIDEDRLEAFYQLFKDEPIIDFPIEGRLEGKAAIKKYFAEKQKWLFAHCGVNKCLNVINTDYRIIVEFATFFFANNTWRRLTSAIVADLEDGYIVGEIRGYGSTVPLLAHKTLRTPVVMENEKIDVNMPHEIEVYFSGLHTRCYADIVKYISKENSYFQGSQDGAGDIRQGFEALAEFFSQIPQEADSGRSANQIIECSTTLDDAAFGIEFLVNKWMDGPEIDQAGCAVYGINPDGEINSVRLYDDLFDANDAKYL